jgi:hypothetical protein
MIVVGSSALFLRYPQAINRRPADLDLAGTKDEYLQWITRNSSKIMCRQVVAKPSKMILNGAMIVEWDFPEENSTELLLCLVEKQPESIYVDNYGWIPHLDMLFTIKTAHRYLKDSSHFWKTAVDYHTLKSMGAKVRPEYREFLKLREKETYLYNHPRLNTDKATFFSDDAINYVYDHDTIHESVALNDRPAYRYYQKDGSEVQTDREKFFSLPRHIQLSGVVEEAAVLAIERSLVPHPGVKTPKEAWGFALSKVCTSITSGWFREFAFENIFDVLKLYPHNYWEKFQQDLAAGKIKPYK